VSAQVVLVIPVVILLLMLAIQAGLYFHASSIAGAAAAEGAAAASVARLPSEVAARRGQQAAENLVIEAGGQSPAVALVAVEALVPRIIPFFPSSVRRTVIEPRERFTTEVSR
jgi:Flp pilus assembly protein TadG